MSFIIYAASRVSYMYITSYILPRFNCNRICLKENILTKYTMYKYKYIYAANCATSIYIYIYIYIYTVGNVIVFIRHIYIYIYIYIHMSVWYMYIVYVSQIKRVVGAFQLRLFIDAISASS